MDPGGPASLTFKLLLSIGTSRVGTFFVDWEIRASREVFDCWEVRANRDFLLIGRSELLRTLLIGGMSRSLFLVLCFSFLAACFSVLAGRPR